VKKITIFSSQKFNGRFIALGLWRSVSSTARAPGAAPVARVMFREFAFQLDALGKFDEQLGTGCIAVFFSHCLCLVEGCMPFPCAKPTFCLSF